MFNDLIEEFLESKKDKNIFRNSFLYYKYNSLLEEVFDLKDEELFIKIISAKKNELDIFCRKYKNYLLSEGLEFKSISILVKENPNNEKLEKLKSLYSIYGNFSAIWNRRIIDNVKTRTCLYCNREYILKYKNGTTAELDHFYPRSLYPFLSISFYNLIPSCKNCNSKFKKAKDVFLEKEKILYPYEQSVNDNFEFKLDIIDSSFIYDKEGFNIDIKCKNDSAEISKETFKLNDLYQEHKDIVLELIQKREIYPDSYIDELFTQYEGTLFKNREDLLRLITGGYIDDKDIDKRPLSKLIKDISEELDLI